MTDDRYFDYAASSPPFPEALRRFEEVSRDAWGNPSSSHELGRKARETMESARAGVLECLGVPEATLVLCSGATEANTLAIRGVLESAPEGRLLLAADTHPSAWFARDAYPSRVDVLEIGADGRIAPDRLEARLGRKTALVSILHANNETGVVHDVAAIAAICARKQVPLHIDGVQVPGRLPLALDALPCAFYSFSAYKFGGPRGVGGLIVRETAPAPLLRGGGQERGLRAGTENVAGLAAMLVALEKSLEAGDAEIPRLRRLGALLRGDVASIPQAILNSPVDGLPGLVSVSFPDLIGETIVVEMNLRGYAVSAGSACGSGRMEPSRPVLAMGRNRAQALGTVRLSLGRRTTEEAVRGVAAVLREVVERQKALA